MAYYESPTRLESPSPVSPRFVPLHLRINSEPDLTAHRPPPEATRGASINAIALAWAEREARRRKVQWQRIQRANKDAEDETPVSPTASIRAVSSAVLSKYGQRNFRALFWSRPPAREETGSAARFFLSSSSPRRRIDKQQRREERKVARRAHQQQTQPASSVKRCPITGRRRLHGKVQT